LKRGKASALIVLALVLEGGVLLLWQISSASTTRLLLPSPGPAASVTTPPSTSGALTISSKVDFGCSLPMTVYSHRVLVSLPRGGITFNEPQPSASPGASGGSSYIGRRWLSVPPAWVSPDGGSYASLVGASDGSGFDAIVSRNATGTQRQLWKGSGHPTIVGWSSSGLYFLLQPSSSDPRGVPALWVVDPDNPDLAQKVGPNPLFAAAGVGPRPVFSADTKLSGDTAWDTLRNSDDKLDRVQRMDVQTGSVSIWYTAPSGARVSILGFDGQEHPVLQLTSASSTTPQALMLLTGDDQTQSIAGAQGQAEGFTNAFADTHGVWIGSSGVLWLYRNGSLFKVTDVPIGQILTDSSARNAAGSLQAPAVVGPCAKA